jgi:hypothetical protein
MMHEPMVDSGTFRHIAHTHRAGANFTEQFTCSNNQTLFSIDSAARRPALFGEAHLPAVA